MKENKMPAFEAPIPEESTTDVVIPEVLPEAKIMDIAPPVMKFRDVNPSNYSITPLTDGRIEARSTLTGETFTGTIKEFNERLK